MKTLLKENHVQIEKVRALSSQFSYTVVMTNMKLLSVVILPYIYQRINYSVDMFEPKTI